MGGPSGIAVSGKDLFVAVSNVASESSRISKHTTSGATVNPALISGLGPVGDIDGDGRDDVLTYGRESFRVQLSNGDGSFRRATQESYGPGGFVVLAAAYRVTPTSTKMRAADDVSEVRWFPLARVPWRAIAFVGLRGLLRKAVSGGPRRSPA